MGPQASNHAWFSNFPFFASPFMEHIPRPNASIGNGLAITHRYYSFIWYQLQMLLNDGNHAPNPHGVALDWAYSVGYPTQDLTWYTVTPPTGTAGLMTEWMIKALQNALDNTGNPQKMVGFPAQVSSWSDVSTAQEVEIINAYTTAWFAKYSATTNMTQLFDLLTGVASSTNPTQSDFSNDLIYALPQLRYVGVNSTLLDNIASWLAKIWPTYNWNGDLNAPCTVKNQGQVLCTTP